MASGGSGNVSLDGTAKSFGIVVDPADPSVYLDVQGVPVINDFAIAASLNALIPDTATPDGNAFYADFFTKANLNLNDIVKEIPLSVDGSLFVNFDPSHQGLANAAKQYANDFKNALSFKSGVHGAATLLNDLKGLDVAVSGTLNVTAGLNGISVTVPVASASALWVGKQQVDGVTQSVDQLWMHGKVSDLTTGAVMSYIDHVDYALDGSLNMDTGAFALTMSGTDILLGKPVANASLTITNTDIELKGSVNLGAQGTWYSQGFSASGSVTAEADLIINYNGTATFSASGEVQGSVSYRDVSLGSFDEKGSYSKTFSLTDTQAAKDVWSSVAHSAESAADNVFGGMKSAWDRTKRWVKDLYGKIVN